MGGHRDRRGTPCIHVGTARLSRGGLRPRPGRVREARLGPCSRATFPAGVAAQHPEAAATPSCLARTAWPAVNSQGVVRVSFLRQQSEVQGPSPGREARGPVQRAGAGPRHASAGPRAGSARLAAVSSSGIRAAAARLPAAGLPAARLPAGAVPGTAAAAGLSAGPLPAAAATRVSAASVSASVPAAASPGIWGRAAGR